jgi:hypothetical protein
MKNLMVILSALLLFLSGCERAHNKTGGATRDSSANHGNSGPTDSIKAIGSGVNGESANSPGSTDTTTNGHSVAAPVTDSNKKKPRH